MIPRCCCRAALMFDHQLDVWHCWCPACRRRADAGEGDGFVIDVDGYGASREAAEENFKERKATF